MSRYLVLTLVLLLTVAAPTQPIMAQDGDDACPALLETALATASESCGGLGRNRACYGYTRVLAEPRRGAAITFAAPGDLAALADIARLQTSALNVDTGEWGVALMSVQADLPDTLPGQNVTFVLFGEAELRAAPDPTAAYPAPMQAFYLTTGLGQAPCQEAPRDGLLIQAPGETTVHFLINGVEVEVGSTALLRTQEDDTLSINTLAGTITVTAAGERRTALPGQRVDAVAGQAPAPPVPYDAGDVVHAPVELLPEPVEIPPPAAVPAPSGSIRVDMETCFYNPGTVFNVPANRPIRAFIAPGCWLTAEASAAMMSVVTASLTVDGTSMPEISRGSVCSCCPEGEFNFLVIFDVPPLPPGDHIFVGYNDHPQPAVPSRTWSCVVHAE